MSDVKDPNELTFDEVEELGLEEAQDEDDADGEPDGDDAQD